MGCRQQLVLIVSMQDSPTVGWVKTNMPQSRDILLHFAPSSNPAAPIAIIHSFGANGIALDASRRHLYLGNTDFGRIMRVRIREGRADGIEIVTEDDALKGADGIALDERGTLYVAVNALDKIATVDSDGDISTFAIGDPLDAPSSLVFGTRFADHHTMYLTSFSLFRANGLKPGTPKPALLSVPFAQGFRSGSGGGSVNTVLQ